MTITFVQNSFAAEQNQNKNQFNFESDYLGEDSDKARVDQKIYDPFESVNRKVFSFNESLDKNLFLPIARRYQKDIPRPVKRSIRNFFDNLSTPFSVVNSLIQGDSQNSMASFSSFLINTTIGVGGIFDIADAKKIKYNKEDLGQSFAKYGVGTGPYLVFPFFGPSDARDFSGSAIEKLVDPLSINALKIGGDNLIANELTFSALVLSTVDNRESLINVVDDIRENSFDAYSTIRSAYLQRRESLILNK